jgi:DNA polymerase zeta
MFSMSIFMINYYTCRPEPSLDEVYSDFRCSEIKQVPVIRVFGSTPEGQKTCLHVHNVFPYLLIKPSRSAVDNGLGKFAYELANQIDRVLNISLCARDPSSQQVYQIEPIYTK